VFTRRIVIASLAFSPISSAFGQAKHAGAIGSLVGTATAERASNTLALAVNDPVFDGDSLATDKASRLSATLGASTRLQLSELTQVTIDKFLIEAGGVIELKSGSLLLDKPNTTRAIDVRSRFGLIAVRGTKVFAGPSRSNFGVFVVRGSVTVSNAGKTVEIAEGFGTDIAAPTSQPIDAIKWSEERIKASLATFS
jgi:ferric-dicitrate binding protein FerR (iron transport regulator)